MGEPKSQTTKAGSGLVMGRNLSKGSPPQSLSPGQKDLADTRETKNNKKWGCVGRGFWFSACDIFATAALWAR